MLTTRHPTSPFAAARTSTERPSAQTVVIVNGDSNALHLLEPVLEAGNYHVVFVEAGRHAYSQIRRTQPNLVILCLQFDDPEGFQVLSMLKLDETTRGIPIVTCTGQSPVTQDEDVEEDDESDAPLFTTPSPPVLMN